MSKYFKKIDIKTIIYFSVLAILYVPMLLTGNLNFDRFAYILLIATIVYVIATKKWYFFQIAISIFLLAFGIEFLQSAFYEYTLKDPSFIVSSLLFSYFLIIFFTTLTAHAEWTIRSPWIATGLGLIGAIITELMLIILAQVKNVYLVGLDGILIMLLLSGLYLGIGKKIFVHIPKKYNGFDPDFIEGALELKGFFAKKNKKSEIIVFDKTDKTKSYRLFFSSEKIITRDTDKLINNFVIIRNRKMVPVYSWLLRETSKSFEIRGPKPIQSQQFIVISVTDKTAGTKIVDVPIPRTNRTHKFALITISEKDKKQIGNLIEQATVMLNTK
jgi:hypothetical protein